MSADPQPPKPAEPLNVDQLSKSLEELVSIGCKFVVEGELFKSVIDLIEKLLVDGQPDKHGEAYLLSVRHLLLSTSKPVKAKLGFADDNKEEKPRIQVVSQMPDLPPGLPPSLKG